MAEEKDKKEEGAAPEAEQAAPKKSRKSLLLGGGVLGLIAAGWAVSLVAMPGRSRERMFSGPFVVTLSPDEVQVNLLGEGGKRFLVMTLQAEFDAYEEAYATSRVGDTLYQAKLKDALIRVGRQKTKAELDDAVGEDVFKEEVREAIDPLLFPLHFHAEDVNGADEASGLRPGRSIERSSLRGGYWAHTIELDEEGKKARLDEGPETTFAGDEQDLVLENEHHETVYVDVSQLEPGFEGRVQVGTFGRIRKIYFGKLLVQ